MPRRVQPGPHIKRVELLTTGQEYRPVTAAVDDWGQPIVSKVDNSPLVHLPDAQELQDAANRAKRKAKQLLLQRITQPKLIAPPFKRRF